MASGCFAGRDAARPCADDRSGSTSATASTKKVPSVEAERTYASSKERRAVSAPPPPDISGAWYVPSHTAPAKSGASCTAPSTRAASRYLPESDSASQQFAGPPSRRGSGVAARGKCHSPLSPPETISMAASKPPALAAKARTVNCGGGMGPRASSSALSASALAASVSAASIGSSDSGWSSSQRALAAESSRSRSARSLPIRAARSASEPACFSSSGSRYETWLSTFSPGGVIRSSSSSQATTRRAESSAQHIADGAPAS
mmetsp:Transcript_37967/g.113602  ORF Transcript_37967/g.113602 Transcript_37967/m.113602 type:complete len:261 (+) Transcript_37967:2420-3202(+)